MSDPPIFYMDDAIRPYRSMSRLGLAVVLGVFVAFNLLIAIFLFAIGAFPAPIFLGVDVVGVLVAFHISNLRARSGERVQVTHDEVRVIKEHASGDRTLWTSPTAFTRIEIDKDEARVARVRVRLSTRSLAIGAALGPKELADFARRLQAAVSRALAERHA